MGLDKLVDRARTYEEYARLMDEAGEAWGRIQREEPITPEEAVMALYFVEELKDLVREEPDIQLAVEARKFSREVLVP